MADWPVSEQELQIESLFHDLDKLFKRAEKQKAKPDKLYNTMKEVSTKLKESKALLKDFEREARTDGMPAPLMQHRKKAISDKLNGFIARKRDIANSVQSEELFTGAVVKEEDNIELMSNQQLMQKGRKDMAQIDADLNRAERLVEDTVQVGTNAAGALHDQTNQLNKIVDDLADIEFNVKKASKVITDITRGLLTDKCIGFLLFAAIAGVIVIIVLKVVNPNKKNIQAGLQTINNATNITGIAGSLLNQVQDATQGAINNAVDSLPTGNTGRRMLRDVPQQLLGLMLADETY